MFLKILNRILRHKRIHFDIIDSATYGSKYIKGINQLYEFSCGELSGWMFRINGVYPNYGFNKVYPKDGDYIEFIYTCDLGRDIGGNWEDQYESV